jgi:DNA polymerase III, gamma and tau subunit
LKILEEPPSHVKFILATTETHKVPETIISRCQRYDFKRIDEENIRKRLLFIAESENVKIDEKSLNYIISSSN